MFGNCFAGKKVLVTGHTGFKGSWLSTWLLNLGAEVIGVSKDIPSEPSMFKVLGLDKKVQHHQFNLLEQERTEELIVSTQADFVFHLAAQAIVSKSYQDPVETIQTNVLGTTYVLDALRKSNHPCVAILITSDKCYDNVEWVWGYKESDHLGGKDVYSGSKGAAELMIKCYFNSFFKNKESQVKLASARAGNVVGGGDWALDRIIPDSVRAWSQNKPVTIRSPEATRPWQHVLEPLSGYLRLAQLLLNQTKLHGENYNFGPRPEYNHRVIDILKDMSRQWSFSSTEDAYQVVDEIKFHEAGLLKLNCDKALSHLKWQPNLDYETFVKLTSDWYYRYYQKTDDMFELTKKQIKTYESFARNQLLSWTL